MKVYSMLKPRPFKASPSGSRYVNEVILDESKRQLVATGLKTDLKAMINSYAIQVDIQRLIKQRDITGDNSILMKKQGFFIDSRNMPRTNREVYDSILKAEKVYHTLPSDVKSTYKSFNDFCSRADFFKVLDKYNVKGNDSVPAENLAEK